MGIEMGVVWRNWVARINGTWRARGGGVGPAGDRQGYQYDSGAELQQSRRDQPAEV